MANYHNLILHVHLLQYQQIPIIFIKLVSMLNNAPHVCIATKPEVCQTQKIEVPANKKLIIE